MSGERVLRGRCDGDQLLGVDEGAGGGERRDHEVDAAGRGVGDGFRRAAIRHVRQLDLGRGAQPLDLEMRGAGDAARAEHHFARRLAGLFDQFVEGRDALVGRNPSPPPADRRAG